MSEAPLGALVQQLLIDRDLPHQPELDALRVGERFHVALADEVAEYVACSQSLSFRRAVHTILAVHNDQLNVWPVRETRSILFHGTRSDAVTFLAGGLGIAADPDSGSVVVMSWQHGAVASFLFDDASPADASADLDFAVEGESMRAWLRRYGEPEPREEWSAGARELARLYRRGIWLAQLFQEVEDPLLLDSPRDIARAARDASPFDVYEVERDQFVRCPHFAAYWLLAHAVTGRTDALRDAVERTAGSSHPVVVELRSAAPELLGELTKRRPDLTPSALESMRGLAPKKG